jgi:hypothetical protein
MKFSSRMLFAATPLVSAALGLLTVPLMTWTLPVPVIAQFRALLTILNDV